MTFLTMFAKRSVLAVFSDRVIMLSGAVEANFSELGAITFFLSVSIVGTSEAKHWGGVVHSHWDAQKSKVHMLW